MNRPPYKDFPVLESEGIIMREIRDEELEDIISISSYDGARATNLVDVKNMLSKIEQDYLTGNSINWWIADKVTNTIVGTCGYYRGFNDLTGELGFILREEYRRKGYMSKAIRLAVHFGLYELKLKRIIAITTIANHSAISLLEKLKFVKVAEQDDERVEYEYRQ